MCAKLASGSLTLVCVAFGVSVAFGSAPLGLREALAEFETGATKPTPCAADRAVGSRNEISRFQILPAVWRQYSASRNYHDPETAWNVAVKILSDRHKSFQKATSRDWDYFDIYVMWNAPGQYRRANWNRARISPIVRERAERFSNLMHERARRYAHRN
jgi:hypothetical protein